MADKLNGFFGNKFHKRVFFICLCISIILLLVSWVMPPAWVIDKSILAAVGELFGFSALGEVMAAIERGKKATISKGDISLSVGDIEPTEPTDDTAI